jgi:cytochrome c biogenesis protein CcmG, thiol:disulfide interchange protein DsbE
MRQMVVLAVGALAIAGCGAEQAPSAGPPDRAALTGAPAPLASLHRRSNKLLDGGARAFKRELKHLRGYPVVVNKWASWCPPCRAEFPFFQRQAVKHGKRIAFLGVDSDDGSGDAGRKFLREYPVAYPSFLDPTLAIAAVFNGVQAFPSTAFYDSRGELAYLHQGGYQDESKLATDIRRYAR